MRWSYCQTKAKWEMQNLERQRALLEMLAITSKKAHTETVWLRNTCDIISQEVHELITVSDGDCKECWYDMNLIGCEKLADGQMLTASQELGLAAAAIHSKSEQCEKLMGFALSLITYQPKIWRKIQKNAELKLQGTFAFRMYASSSSSRSLAAALSLLNESSHIASAQVRLQQWKVSASSRFNP